MSEQRDGRWKLVEPASGQGDSQYESPPFRNLMQGYALAELRKKLEDGAPYYIARFVTRTARGEAAVRRLDKK
jgi:hypothetical protein